MCGEKKRRENRRKGMFSQKRRGKTKEETKGEREVEEIVVTCPKTFAAEVTTEIEIVLLSH